MITDSGEHINENAFNVFSKKKNQTVMGLDPSKKAFEDKGVNAFFWQFLEDCPDWTRAFSRLGISLFEARKLMERKEYKEAITLAKNIVYMRIKNRLYKKVSIDSQEEGNQKLIESVVKMFENESKRKGKEIGEEDEGEDMAIPDYLKESAGGIKKEDEMKNNMDGLPGSNK